MVGILFQRGGGRQGGSDQGGEPNGGEGRGGGMIVIPAKHKTKVSGGVSVRRGEGREGRGLIGRGEGVGRLEKETRKGTERGMVPVLLILTVLCVVCAFNGVCNIYRTCDVTGACDTRKDKHRE